MYSLYSFLSFSFILSYKYEHVKGINNKKLKTENVSIEDVYEALSDNKALVLFNTIALADDDDVSIERHFKFERWDSQQDNTTLE